MLVQSGSLTYLTVRQQVVQGVARQHAGVPVDLVQSDLHASNGASALETVGVPVPKGCERRDVQGTGRGLAWGAVCSRLHDPCWGVDVFVRSEFDAHVFAGVLLRPANREEGSQRRHNAAPVLHLQRWRAR